MGASASCTPAQEWTQARVMLAGMLVVVVFVGGVGALCLRVRTDADARNAGVAGADASACAMDAVVGYILWWTRVAASSGRSWIWNLSS